MRTVINYLLNESQGQRTFDMTGLAAGAYILVLWHEGERIGQQILIKE